MPNTCGSECRQGTTRKGYHKFSEEWYPGNPAMGVKGNVSIKLAKIKRNGLDYGNR